MNSETRNQKMKSCNACKRLLPIYFFGTRRFSNDGYNPCCKECRNFRRRQAYQNPGNDMDPIFPLSSHNQHFLWSIPDSVKADSFIGLDLKSLQSVEVLFYFKKRDTFWLTAKMANKCEYTHIHSGTKAEFIDNVVIMLERLNVRLFYPSDINALNNWGISSK